jgi:uncharacterized protein (DUF2252 family)
MKSPKLTKPNQRASVLADYRAVKMAQSAHAYVRGNTVKFYEWLNAQKSRTLPEGPATWICGDCHAGNLGPVADASGRVEIQIRDLDQTVIGNPAHDLIRLGLSLATASRGSDLPGVTTARILEQMIVGYEEALAKKEDDPDDSPEAVDIVMKQAVTRSWKRLAEERIKDTKPTIPLGAKFWPLTAAEKAGLKHLFKQDDVRHLITMLRSRDDDADVEMVDAAYWMKGCSSLGKLRLAVLLRVGNGKKDDLCLIDIKEAIKPAAPHYAYPPMPRNNAHRVVEGARHLSPYLGKRMVAARLLNRSIFMRELLPQDLKLEIEQLTQEEAMKAGRYLASVVGKAHGRQMDASTRESWSKELARNRSKSLDAPSWLWSSVVALIAFHEAAYLEHCRQFATQAK